MALNKRTGYKIRQKDFKQLKALLEAELSYGEIKRLTGRSLATIRFIKKSKTLSDYHRITKEFASRYKKVEKKEKGNGEVKKQKNDFASIHKRLDEIQKICIQINNSIDGTELMENTNKKVRFFSR